MEAIRNGILLCKFLSVSSVKSNAASLWELFNWYHFGDFSLTDVGKTCHADKSSSWTAFS